jgi:hypothetical protein
VRRFLHILGILTLIVILAAGIGLGVLIYQGRTLDTESTAFVDGAVPAIAATWDEQQLLDRATPELRASVTPGELRAVFNRLSQFGPLVEYQGATGQATMSYVAGSGGTVSATYAARARCQNGTATFRVVLLKRDGRWLIHNFHIDSTPGNQPGQQRT